jgi:hypothetical protein
VQRKPVTAQLVAEVKARAILIEKLRHKLAGQRAHRFGASSETAEQLHLALEASEIAAAAMTAQMRPPGIEEKDKPKRRPTPGHIPRMEVELTPGTDACAECGGRLCQIGEDVTEKLEYLPEPSPLPWGQWRRMARHREPHRPLPGIGSQELAKASTRRITSPDTAAGCMPALMVCRQTIAG